MRKAPWGGPAVLLLGYLGISFNYAEWLSRVERDQIEGLPRPAPAVWRSGEDYAAPPTNTSPPSGWCIDCGA